MLGPMPADVPADVPPDEPLDHADHHVARWLGHEVMGGATFDPTIEAIVVRMGRILRYFASDTKEAARRAGLQLFEYETLHALMIRDTPGHASPTALAADLDVSPAGMTRRLEVLEEAGYVRRVPDPGDRRRVGVEATDAGQDVWRRAMGIRGRTEADLLELLTPTQRAEMAAALKQLTLAIEQGA